MHHSFAVLVITERFHRQREQSWFFFREHGGHLPFGGAVDACIRPACFPAIQIGLRLFQILETLSFQRRSLGVANGGLHLAFSIWILDPAGQGDRTVVCQHVAIERIDSGIVEVWDQHAFAKVIEHQEARSPTQSTKRLLVELGPDARAGTEHQQPYRLAAIAQREHEQTGAAVLAAVRLAHHRPAAVIDLTLFSWSGEDHRPRLWYLGSAQLVSETPTALIPTLESVVGDQILPDCHCIAISTQTQLDDFPVRFTGAR